MDPVEWITQRVSSPRLSGDIPDEIMSGLEAAAARAPDHAQLKPFRCLVISGEGLTALGDLFVAALTRREPESTQAELDKIRRKPLRAPFIVVGIASLTEHVKVPEIEQLLSAGIALQNISQAIFALGYGAMWRTGAMAYDETVKSGLGLLENEQIVGFLYLGEIEGRLKPVHPVVPGELMQRWP
ncbi:MAG TPA: nitroreductase [Gammaproteobacteria bacterium]|nr:nitroreductase [Gammaproteobacteria bacterium]HIK69067.1 nitroreductase [Pseudomonadales bacterium]